jgi:hypothetical protein
MNPTEKYEEGIAAHLANYDRKTTRQKYAKSEWYQKYKQAIYVGTDKIILDPV